MILRSFIAALLAIASSAVAQCPMTWHAAPSGTASTSVSGGVVYAAATYDPPSTTVGPRAIIAGTFTTVAGFACNRIAQWDGTMWLPLGTGMNGPVFALAVFNGELVAGGSFTTAGGVACNNIARWNGTSWQPLGSGLNGSCLALTVVFTLHAGGSFTTAGGVSASRVAKWSGSSWSAMESGVNGTVSAIALHNSGVVVGGQFTTAGGLSASNIAFWDGGAWHALGAGVSARVDSVAVFNAQVYAGGNFGQANGSATFVSGFTRWNGSTWEALGTAGTGVSSGAAPPHVYSMRVFQNTLYLGGLFDLAGGIDCAGIAKFDGTNFSPVGIPGSDGVGPPQAQVFAMTDHQGSLLVCGSFNTAGGQPSSPVARWNGSEWTQLSGQPSGPVNCLSIYRGNLVAGGTFDFNTQPGLIALNLAQYTPGNVAAPFENLNGFTGPNGTVLAVIPGSTSIINPSLIVAGSFTQLQGLNCANIGQLDQFNEVSTVGSGLNATVRVLRRFGNIIHAGGDFTLSGATTVNRIARFTGGAWQPLGTGIANGQVLAMAEFGGSFYVGGSFTTAGGVATGALARWDGTNWFAVGGVYPGTVKALTVFNGQLIIAGTFPGAPGPGNPNVCAFNGTTYVPLGPGLGSYPEGMVNAVAVHQGELYAAGSFSKLNQPQPVNVARWNGSAWTVLENTNVNGTINCLQSFNGALWAGGGFTNGSGHFIPNIARLFCDCYSNCDGSTGVPVLSANDFLCFVNQFAIGSAYANCDRSTGNPSLTANDFTCFINGYAVGCP